MRIVPRSALGTWLLAGAAWAGLCAFAWLVLPPRQRGEWQLSTQEIIAGVQTNSDRIVTVTLDAQTEGATNERAVYRGPVRIRSAITGRELANHLAPGDTFGEWRLSNKGRWLALYDPAPNRDGLTLLDLIDGKTVSVPGHLPYMAYIIGSDDFVPIHPSPGQVRRLTDTGRLTPLPAIDGIWPLAVSPDGRAIAVGLPGSRNTIISSIRVVDSNTWRTRATIRIQRDAEFVVDECGFRPNSVSELSVQMVAISNEGRVLVTGSNRQEKDSLPELACWDVVTGQNLLLIKGNFWTAFAADGQTFVTQAPPPPGVIGSRGPVTIWDIPSGKVRCTLSVPHDVVRHYAAPQLSPDGKTLAVPVAWPAASTIETWVKRRGWWWPYPIQLEQSGVLLYSTLSGQLLGRVPGDVQVGCLRWVANSEHLILREVGDSRVVVWDIPPRKSLTWFAVAAALLALPIVWLARRRVRRLRSLAGFNP